MSKNPGNNHWLLTGWKNNKTAANAIGEVHDSSDATTVTPTRTRRNGDATVSNISIAEEASKSNSRTSTREPGFGANSYPTTAAYKLSIADAPDVVSGRLLVCFGYIEHF